MSRKSTPMTPEKRAEWLAWLDRPMRGQQVELFPRTRMEKWLGVGAIGGVRIQLSGAGKDSALKGRKPAENR